MKQTTTLVLLGVAVAAGLGAFGTSTLFADSTETSTFSNAATMVGHLTITAYDENGNVKAYRQIDNVVLDDGDDCIADLIFDPSTGACTNEATFDKVQIGTGSDSSTAETDASSATPITCTDAVTTTTEVVTAASGGGASSTLLTANFVDPGAATYNEAALKDATTCSGGVTGGNTLAYQQFTGIALGATDDLTIQWTINIDGS